MDKLGVSDPTFASGNVGVVIYPGPMASHLADNFCTAVGTGNCP